MKRTVPRSALAVPLLAWSHQRCNLRYSSEDQTLSAPLASPIPTCPHQEGGGRGEGTRQPISGDTCQTIERLFPTHPPPRVVGRLDDPPRRSRDRHCRTCETRRYSPT